MNKATNRAIKVRKFSGLISILLSFSVCSMPMKMNSVGDRVDALRYERLFDDEIEMGSFTEEPPMLEILSMANEPRRRQHYRGAER